MLPIIRTVESALDLKSILKLQSLNHRSVVGHSEKSTEGFVSIKHEYALLEKMNSPIPHIIAVDHNKVVGYTLVMQKSFRDEIPLLHSMFEMIDRSSYQGLKLKDEPYFIMGQVCVARMYRGKGLFRKLYAKLVQHTKDHFRFMITEVSTSNPRSMEAHKAIGFKTILSHEDGEDQWELLIYDLNPKL